jgi:hypothetical protein
MERVAGRFALRADQRGGVRAELEELFIALSARAEDQLRLLNLRAENGPDDG